MCVPCNCTLAPSFQGFDVCQPQCPALSTFPAPYSGIWSSFSRPLAMHSYQRSIKSIPPLRSHLLPQMCKINNPTLQNVLNTGPFICMGRDVRLYKGESGDVWAIPRLRSGEVAPLVPFCEYVQEQVLEAYWGKAVSTASSHSRKVD